MTADDMSLHNLDEAARQQQFLDVIDRDEARARFHAHLTLQPLGTETVTLSGALNRVLSDEIRATVDVPGFDRANVDGFAVQAADTFGASEDAPRSVSLNDEVITPGVQAGIVVQPGTATPIATGAVVPRGADAIVMIEHTDMVADATDRSLEINRAVAAGGHITFAGTDIAKGETVIRRGALLTSREIGVLAAIGRDRVEVFRKPRVAVISTGSEIIPPGSPSTPGAVYDSNAAIVSAAVEELGGEPVLLGVIADDETKLRAAVQQGLDCDIVVLSGGTSKGAGDLSYRVVSELSDPGIVAHGVALKPGKPICLAVTGGKPVVILPGFPTSAIFTFHEFVAPVIRALAARKDAQAATVTATLPLRVNSERGRTEYLLVSLVRRGDDLAAYPMGKGSGSVTTFSGADGFLTIDSQTEMLDADTRVEVKLLSRELRPADFVAIGSHCVGLDYLLSRMEERGFAVKVLNVGSLGGLTAAARGECDIAGIHLMDAATGAYNRPFLKPGLTLIEGYRRLQGIVYRPGDARFENKTAEQAVAAACADAACAMVNRNTGSGTRILIDQLLAKVRPDAEAPPAGYGIQAKSHNAVAAAVARGSADWGVAIETVASLYDLAFIPLQEEHYDFAVPEDRAQSAAVCAFSKLLQDAEVRDELRTMGFQL
ncbi:Molybdopterin molybdenumtransferase [Symmachiella dynata]|uniref:molybdopterin biosynthesis protein n=1 Tax=Symmachiella dynata TaxID=2527995 RepID=UPI001189D803|nr:molybdopterin biosynthesis protein [Symmachiella dynata]QDT48244.1 Molybdopterin molybdenumtransferase [Symmachiella dynata]